MPVTAFQSSALRRSTVCVTPRVTPWSVGRSPSSPWTRFHSSRRAWGSLPGHSSGFATASSSHFPIRASCAFLTRRVCFNTSGVTLGSRTVLSAVSVCESPAPAVTIGSLPPTVAPGVEPAGVTPWLPSLVEVTAFHLLSAGPFTDRLPVRPRKRLSCRSFGARAARLPVPSPSVDVFKRESLSDEDGPESGRVPFGTLPPAGGFLPGPPSY